MPCNFSVIDLFSGCGGLSYGFVRSGYNVLLGIDNDPVALKTFKLNHSGSDTIIADIAGISGQDILKAVGRRQIDVVIGGPPCQGFSLSGPRKFSDPRNKLYLSFIRLVKELKPRAFLIENVPGIMSLYKGQIKDEIIGRFSKMGYKVSCSKLNSADYGVPQLRNRVFFVGIYKAKEYFKFPPPVLNKECYIVAEEAIGDLPGLEDRIGTDPAPYPGNGELTRYQKYMRQGSQYIHNHIGTRHAEMTKRVISLVPEGCNYKSLPPEYANTRNFHVAWTRFHSKKPAPTVDTGHRHHFHYLYDRVPTVRECARLQSFPDIFIFIGNKSQQYSQAGNAVPPFTAQAIAEEMRHYL
ncbi:MAG: DNA cytosine methyltransferase [Candidatus Omnitrophota bacterium]|nr:MAG: DNA cytosine methyltransferase [Candidatus Omnitrophota bacterium]